MCVALLITDLLYLEDVGDQDNELSEIPLTFDNDLNMSQVLSWGSENGLLRPSEQGNGLTMLEVAGRWSHDKLDETRRWTFQMIMVPAGASIWGWWFVAAVPASAGTCT